MGEGQTQTVPMKLLEQKIGRILKLGETFTTKVGTWKVVCIGKDGYDTYTVEHQP